MLKYCQFLFLFLFLTSSVIGQYSDNPLLEKDIKHIQSLIKKANAGEETKENTTKLYNQAIQKSYEVLAKYDLECDQKGRVLLKIGSSHFYNYEDNEAIRILKDSVLGYWVDCPGLKQRWLWDPAVLLFDLYIINNRLIDAEEIGRFIDSKPEIADGVSPGAIRVYYTSLGYFAAEINDKTLSMQSLKKATQLLKEVDDPSLKFDFHHDFANALYRLGDFSNSIIQYEKALENAVTEEKKGKMKKR